MKRTPSSSVLDGRAGGARRRHCRCWRANPHGTTLYRFVGQLQSAPSGSSLTISVQSGSRPALRALLGQSQAQTPPTRPEHRVPQVVETASRRSSSIGDLASERLVVDQHPSPPRRVARRARGKRRPASWVTTVPSSHLHQQSRCTCSGAGSSQPRTAGSPSTCEGGNPAHCGPLIGQSAQQTFTTGAGTVSSTGQGRVPTVTAAANLKLGDRVIVRIRAAGGSTLADVEATPARRVAEHEPASQEAAQNAQA